MSTKQNEFNILSNLSSLVSFVTNEKSNIYLYLAMFTIRDNLNVITVTYTYINIQVNQNLK